MYPVLASFNFISITVRSPNSNFYFRRKENRRDVFVKVTISSRNFVIIAIQHEYNQHFLKFHQVGKSTVKYKNTAGRPGF